MLGNICGRLTINTSSVLLLLPICQVVLLNLLEICQLMILQFVLSTDQFCCFSKLFLELVSNLKPLFLLWILSLEEHFLSCLYSPCIYGELSLFFFSLSSISYAPFSFLVASWISGAIIVKNNYCNILCYLLFFC